MVHEEGDNFPINRGTTRHHLRADARLDACPLVCGSDSARVVPVDVACDHRVRHCREGRDEMDELGDAARPPPSQERNSGCGCAQCRAHQSECRCAEQPMYSGVLYLACIRRRVERSSPIDRPERNARVASTVVTLPVYVHT